MVDIIPLKKWPGGIGELESGDKIPYAFLGIYGQLAGMRNKIINGKMDIAQRGASLAAAQHNSYVLDRWVFSNLSTAVCTISQQADAPANSDFQNSLRIAVTTADSSVASSDVSAIQQSIEGLNARDLVGKTFTISFWVRSSKVGTHCVSLVNSGADRSYVVEYAVSAANTWEYKTITVPGGLITAGGWNWGTMIGVTVRWGLIAGSTFKASAGVWQTGNFVATANQVNCLDTVGNIFAITGVQLEAGPVATPYEHRPIGLELFLCQRYYELVPLSIATPTMSTGVPSGNLLVASTFVAAKRATPTIARVQDNYLFSALNTSGPTYYLVTQYTVGAYRSNAGSPGQVQFSELVAASAEL